MAIGLSRRCSQRPTPAIATAAAGTGRQAAAGEALHAAAGAAVCTAQPAYHRLATAPTPAAWPLPPAPDFAPRPRAALSCESAAQLFFAVYGE